MDNLTNIASQIILSAQNTDNVQSSDQDHQQPAHQPVTPNQNPESSSSRQQNQRFPKPMVTDEVRRRFIQHTIASPNLSIRSAALIFGLPASTAYGILRRYEESGSIAPNKKGGVTSQKITPEAYCLLEWIVDTTADLTLGAIRNHLYVQLSIHVSQKQYLKHLPNWDIHSNFFVFCQLQETHQK